jgi:hypothetical protein
MTNLLTVPASPIAYGTFSNFSCFNNASLYTDLFLNSTNITGEMNQYLVRGAGTWNVTCVSYENDTFFGGSDSELYVIDKLSQNLSVNASPSSAVLYGTSVTIEGFGNITEGVMLMNGSPVSNPYISTLAGGVYNFSWSVVGDENHTTNSTEILVTVNPLSQPLTLTVSPSSTIVYGTAVNVSGAGNLTEALLYRNGTLVANNELVVLSAGVYNFTWNNSGSENYTANSTSVLVTVDKASSLATLVVYPSSPIVFGTASNFSCSLNISFAPSLYRDTVDITAENNVFVVRPVGSWLVNCTWAGNENYTGSEQTTTYVINNEAIPPLIGSLKVNITSGGNYSFGQGYQFNATISDVSGVSYVWVESNFSGILANFTVTTSVGSEYYFNVGLLGAGNYSYKWYANDSVGNTNKTMQTFVYQVTKSADQIQLLINGVDGDVSAYNNTDTVLNFTVILPEPFNASLYANISGSLTLWNDGVTPLMNYSNANESMTGTYLILANWSGNANYTGSNSSHLLYLTTYVPPVESPVVLAVTTNHISYLPSTNMTFTIYTNVSNTTYKIFADNGSLLFSSLPLNGTGILTFMWVTPAEVGTYLITAQAGAVTADRPFYVYKGFWDIPFEPLVLLMVGIIVFAIGIYFFKQ